LVCWFCPRCISVHQLPPSGTTIVDGDDFINRTSVLYRPMCPSCFEDWRGQGAG
jgi:hypothetical protein